MRSLGPGALCSSLFLTISLVLGWQSHLCNGPNLEIAADQDYRHHGDGKCNIIFRNYFWLMFKCFIYDIGSNARPSFNNRVKESRILFLFGRRWNWSCISMNIVAPILSFFCHGNLGPGQLLMRDWLTVPYPSCQNSVIGDG